MEYPPPPKPQQVRVSDPTRDLEHNTSYRADATPGLDRIPGRCIKMCCGTLLPWLQRIFGGSLAIGYLPCEWWTVKVLALHKPRKTSYASPRSYQPISLLSSVGKILEMIVNPRMMRQLESQCLLSSAQFVFELAKRLWGRA